MRSLGSLFVLLLVLAPWPTAPAFGDETAHDCLDAKGLTRSPRLVNQCSYDVNAFVCCYDQGSLGSCQGNGFLFLEIGAESMASIPSCDRSAIVGACRAPFVFEDVYWDASRDVVVVGPCVNESALDGTGQNEQAASAGGDQPAHDPLALAGAQMSGQDLREVDLRGADLSNANLNAANLFLVDMTDADCRGATFRNANLQYVKLLGADLTDADLTGADMQGTRTRDATFCNTIMPDGTINNDGCT